MASDADGSEARLPRVDASPSPIDEPATPRDNESPPPPPPSSSQVTLPSTEIPASPIDVGHSFDEEPLDDRRQLPPATTVIASSLTPPPSTQAPAQNLPRRSHFSPADCDAAFVPPTPQQVLNAPPDELRAMLQTCIAEHQKLKMEAAHHKLQYNLLSLQADEDSKRAVVEHDMVRREVDALRLAEHGRQARRELSTSSDAAQARYLHMRACYHEALHEAEALGRRLKAAKRIIHQKEEETVGLSEERDVLLTRIRENREHFHMLCSPGGIFHGALTPRLQSASTPQLQRPAAQHAPRVRRRDEGHGPEHGLSALIHAISRTQDNNGSAPSTPRSSQRAAERKVGKHGRNAQSMSSLPTTPLNRTDDGGLMASLDVVAPHTEPRQRTSHAMMAPTTPQRGRRPKSRESTISVEDNEELARQALESAAAAVQGLESPQPAGRRRRGSEDGPVLDSRASQAAAELLRRDAGDAMGSTGARGNTRGPAEKSARMQARLLSDSLDKRKYGGMEEHEGGRKKMRVGGPLTEEARVGLGIQYGS